GQGESFKEDMKKLLDHLKSAIPAMFKSNEYFFKKRDIDEWLKIKQEDAFFEIIKEAKEDNLLVEYTQEGYSISPTNDKEVLTPKQYNELSDKEKEKIKENIQKYRERIDTVSSQVVSWSNEASDRMQKLEKQISQKAMKSSFDKLLQKYKEHKDITAYLHAVQKDMIENAKDFLPSDSSSEQIISLAGSEPDFSVYDVNLLVNNKNQKGAPVVYEDNPTYTNMFGVVEYMSQMGALITDFNYIKPGAMHLANGGYLILDMQKVLMQPYVWEGLKRMLEAKNIKIDTLSDALGLNATVTLQPQKVPLGIKIVLLGSRQLYYMLYNYDEDFQKLFKISADFEDSVHKSSHSLQNYAKLIAKIARKDKTLPLQKAAVERVIEYASRMSESSQKLTTKIMLLSDVIKEASYLARDKKQISKEDIQSALGHKEFRASRVQENIYEAIHEGTIMLDLQGAVVGQINGMSVLDMGDISFGEPVKITALTRLGHGEVVDIQREVDLGGPIHSKGVMILSSYLSHKYAKESVLSMSASLSFEQSYGQIEGDSASLAELCAIISSLSNIPIDQSFAVTGSINQMGQVQPVGGINEKIEGFFDVCKRLGHRNNKVIIPHGNIKHLMLKSQVVQAVEKEQFTIYGVTSVDEAIELLMQGQSGKEIGVCEFEKGSINAAVAARLKVLAQKAHQKQFKKKKENNA
ncbi:MAG: Lon protease family protein, partial [Campylobacterota bacterium]